MRTGFESFTAGVRHVGVEDNGLMILICFGTSGTVSAAFVDEMECEEVDSELDFGDVTSRKVGGDIVDGRCPSADVDFAIERRMIRVFVFVEDVVSFEI